MNVIVVSGAHRAAEHASAVRFEPARRIERQDGCGIRRRVDPRDALGKRAGYVALESDAEEAIDHEAARTGARQVGRRFASGLTPRMERGRGVRRKLAAFAAEGHDHVEPPALQMPREHERIAAVVAGTCEDDDAPAAASSKLAGKFGRGKSRALHELRFVRRCRCACFERANLGSCGRWACRASVRAWFNGRAHREVGRVG